jgi:hypothetical protein
MAAGDIAVAGIALAGGGTDSVVIAADDPGAGEPGGEDAVACPCAGPVLAAVEAEA